MKISKEEAKKFITAYQNLYGNQELSGKEGILSFIKKVGCIQFDPLKIIDNNHNLVLQSRIKNYKEELIRELLYIDRKLLDGWDKNMSIYHINDWCNFELYRDDNKKNYESIIKENIEYVNKIKSEIMNRGALSSLEFKFDQKINWSWAPTKLSRAILDSLFSTGELIVSNKKGNRKYYDFSEKLIPKEHYYKEGIVERENLFKWLVERRIGSIGMLWNKASDAWLGIKWMKTKERKIAFESLKKEKKIVELQVEGIKETFYIKADYLPLIETIKNQINLLPKCNILAPLDNMLWDRKLIKEIFDFDYKWEVYTPKVQRKYGYYVLPVMYGENFIGRFDGKFDKKKKEFVILNWWWEDKKYFTSKMKNEVNKSFKEFIKYLGAETIVGFEKI